MENLCEKAVIFTRQHTKALILNAFICIVCYGHLVFSQNIGIDTETAISHSVSVMHWETLGRYGLVGIKYLLGFSQYNPYMEGVLFLGSFIVLGGTAAFFCWILSRGNEDYPYGWFMVLFSVCPVWMTQFYFSLQRAEVVLAMLCAVISAMALCAKIFFQYRGIWLYVVYIFFGVCSICSYQGCAALYIGFLIMAYLLDFFWQQNQEWKYFIKNILLLAAGFLILYIVNSIIIAVFFHTDGYLTEQVKWGQMPLIENLYNIAGHVFSTFVWIRPGRISAYPLAFLCVCSLFFKYRGTNKGMLFLGLAGLLAVPFLMSIYLGAAAKTRTQFAQPLVSAFGCMLYWGICTPAKAGNKTWRGWAGRFGAVLFLWCCASTVFRLQYTDDVRYRQDVTLAQEIADRLYSIEGAEELPVIFIGKREAPLNASSLDTDMFGASFFTWDWTEEDQTGSTARIVGLMNALGIHAEYGGKFADRALKDAEGMTCYPCDGSILVKDKYTVIKLSEISRNHLEVAVQ